ncbi:hypothetical protein LPU83_pLPU83c_0087 (plasmid) [Rhizobium favelukesii]|uniref:Uncharacterized protein n=1 Tax=Rhizobium favelukesii TaxID=348824 RepID=W6RIG1_9HYPH|nr:hypothetical protein LPU83_pLPU83c_0087 [Rhizobium favelukesii]
MRVKRAETFNCEGNQFALPAMAPPPHAVAAIWLERLKKGCAERSPKPRATKQLSASHQLFRSPNIAKNDRPSKTQIEQDAKGQSESKAEPTMA